MQNQLNIPMKPATTPAAMPAAEPPARLRSSAVARLTSIPVATLRIWEQRYQAVRPETAPSGHRRYAPQDIQRVLLLRQLTQQGHAIGTIATLSDAQLLQLVSQLDSTSAPTTGSALRTLVLGRALGSRLMGAVLHPALARPHSLLAPAETLAEALLSAAGNTVDLLLWDLPGLQAEIPLELRAAQRTWPDCKVAVVYRYAGASALARYAAAGIAVWQEAPDDALLAEWLNTLSDGLPRGASVSRSPRRLSAPDSTAQTATSDAAAPPMIAPRRFDDTALSAIASMAPLLDCACPQHVAGLLRQLADFEDYSASCASHDARDAEIHHALQYIAAMARTQFETALVQLAAHQGIALDVQGPTVEKVTS